MERRTFLKGLALAVAAPGAIIRGLITSSPMTPIILRGVPPPSLRAGYPIAILRGGRVRIGKDGMVMWEKSGKLIFDTSRDPAFMPYETGEYL